MNIIHNKYLDYEEIIQSERERISSLIHNQLAQDLTALSIHSEAIQSISKNDEVLMHTRYINNLIKQSRKNVKEIIWNLDRNNNGYDVHLAQAINELLIFWKNTDKRVVQQFEVVGDVGAIPNRLKLICFESIKEAVTNVYRHAMSESLVVHISVESNFVRMRVSDNGIGFDAKYSNGLNGIHNKLKSVYGSLKILTNKNHGTTLHIYVPFMDGQ